MNICSYENMKIFRRTATKFHFTAHVDFNILFQKLTFRLNVNILTLTEKKGVGSDFQFSEFPLFKGGCQV